MARKDVDLDGPACKLPEGLAKKKGRLAVEMAGVHAGYENETVLKDVSIDIEDGEFLAIIGPNGGGKSTFFRVLLGLLRPYKGEVRVFGEPPDMTRHLIGYVPQYALYDRQFPIDVWNVVLMGRVGGLGFRPFFSPGDKAIAEESLRKVEMLEYRDRQLSKLSGGQQQRVFIARALASQPRLLLLDEPTASVDKKMQESIFELLKKLNEEMTIILVTHDVGIVSAYVNKIGCLNKYLIYHDDREITAEMLEAAYECPVDVIAHGVTHRHFEEHDRGNGNGVGAPDGAGRGGGGKGDQGVKTKHKHGPKKAGKRKREGGG